MTEVTLRAKGREIPGRIVAVAEMTFVVEAAWPADLDEAEFRSPPPPDLPPGRGGGGEGQIQWFVYQKQAPPHPVEFDLGRSRWWCELAERDGDRLTLHAYMGGNVAAIERLVFQEEEKA